jgi:hypothetical protein
VLSTEIDGIREKCGDREKDGMMQHSRMGMGRKSRRPVDGTKKKRRKKR